MLEQGRPAPEFELDDQDGNEVSLSDLSGQWLVLFFYPKAMTPGCTREAREFHDLLATAGRDDVRVLGVSTDPVEDICEFAEREDLDITLLSDPDGAVARTYESFDTVQTEGEEWEVAVRNTYLIGPDGVIERTYENVDPKTHPEQVLADIESLAGAD